jgi:hypothetical protein
MFEVRAHAPVDEYTESTIEVMDFKAGRSHDFFNVGERTDSQDQFRGGTQFCTADHDQGWLVDNIEEALEIRDKLNTIPGVRCLIREHETGELVQPFPPARNRDGRRKEYHVPGDKQGDWIL